jgi:hypothetical protein
LTLVVRPAPHDRFAPQRARRVLGLQARTVAAGLVIDEIDSSVSRHDLGPSACHDVRVSGGKGPPKSADVHSAAVVAQFVTHPSCKRLASLVRGDDEGRVAIPHRRCPLYRARIGHAARCTPDGHWSVEYFPVS